MTIIPTNANNVGFVLKLGLIYACTDPMLRLVVEGSIDGLGRVGWCSLECSVRLTRALVLVMSFFSLIWMCQNCYHLLSGGNSCCFILANVTLGTLQKSSMKRYSSAFREHVVLCWAGMVQEGHSSSQQHSNGCDGHWLDSDGWQILFTLCWTK